MSSEEELMWQKGENLLKTKVECILCNMTNAEEIYRLLTELKADEKILEKIREAKDKNNLPAFLIFLNLGLIDVVRRIRKVENRKISPEEGEKIKKILLLIDEMMEKSVPPQLWLTIDEFF
jgi:hypothetical protein